MVVLLLLVGVHVLVLAYPCRNMHVWVKWRRYAILAPSVIGWNKRRRLELLLCARGR